MDLRNKKIVVIYMLYFGDMVSLSPFLHVLRRAAEGSEITLVIDHRVYDAVRFNPNVDHIIPVDRKKQGLFGAWKLGRKLGGSRPDFLFVMHGTTRTTLMALGLRAKYWTGETGACVDRFLMDQPLLVHERRDCHAAEKYLEPLRALGVKNLSFDGMEIFTGKEWERAAEKFYDAHNIRRGDSLVGISVGSSTPEKNWPAERFGAVADYFSEKGYTPIFFGIPSEKPLVEKALATMKHADRAVVAAGELSMGEFMAAVSWCGLAFTNDSGPMYIFDSRGVPTVAFFGPSNVRLHHPLGKRSVALATTDIPLTYDNVNHIVRDKAYTPMDAIPVEEAVRAGEWALGLVEDEKYERHFVVVR